MEPPIFLTVMEATRLLNVSHSALYRQIRCGELPIVKIGTSTRLHKDDVLAWAEKRPQESLKKG